MVGEMGECIIYGLLQVTALSRALSSRLELI